MIWGRIKCPNFLLLRHSKGNKKTAFIFRHDGAFFFWGHFARHPIFGPPDPRRRRLRARGFFSAPFLTGRGFWRGGGRSARRGRRPAVRARIPGGAPPAGRRIFGAPPAGGRFSRCGGGARGFGCRMARRPPRFARGPPEAARRAFLGVPHFQQPLGRSNSDGGRLACEFGF